MEPMQILPDPALDPRLNDPIARIYRQYNRRGEPGKGRRHGPDAEIRHPEWTRALLNSLGRPDRSLPTIMVTGSKGKGSTAFYLATVLRAHGLRVGFFSSPHLVDNLERLRIDGRAISADDFLAVFRSIEPHLDRLQTQIPPDQYLGPVGTFAAMAALWFLESRVDVAVVETGRGARFDDVAEWAHEGAVITTILPEHIVELGPTLRDIAWHKSGVVRPETRWVIAPAVPVLTPFLDHSDMPAERLWAESWRLSDVTVSRSGVGFTLDGDRGHLVGQVPALAGFAADNARLALMAAARFLGPAFQPQVGLDALQSARFPGRADLITPPTGPRVLVDGAVRRESAEAIVTALPHLLGCARPILPVVSVPDDKDWHGVADQLEKFGPITFCNVTNPRLRFPEAPHQGYPGAVLYSCFQEAWPHLVHLSPPHAWVLALGTQSFVADVLKTLNRASDLLQLYSDGSASQFLQ